MRENIKEADEILGLYFPVLDSGHIALLDYMGSDSTIVQAARNSYSKGTKTVSDDRGLIRRLMRDRHTSPFEFAELKFHVRAPLYVIQQWLRHRTSNFCQESHRYSEVKDDFQKTEPNAWRLQNPDNKQGSSGFLAIESVEQGDWGGYDMSRGESLLHEHLKMEYRTRIRRGVAREQARKDIPHSTYSSLYVKCDVHNLLHFMKLRTDGHAQQEIRDYADIIAGMVKRVCPLVYEAWIDYAYGAKSFSRLDLEFLQYLGSVYAPGFEMRDWQSSYETDIESGSEKVHEKIGMTKKELLAFWNKLNPLPIPNFDLDLSKTKTEKEMKESSK